MNPAKFPLGSPLSRASARALLNARRRESTLVLIHRIPRPEYPDRPAPEQTEDGSFITYIRIA